MWYKSSSSGRNLISDGFSLAKSRKSSLVKPSIWGTADTFTPYLFTYYNVIEVVNYILVTIDNLFEKEGVDWAHLWKVGFTLLCEEDVDFSLRVHLLHEFMNVDLLQILWLNVHHSLNCFQISFCKFNNSNRGCYLTYTSWVKAPMRNIY